MRSIFGMHKDYSYENFKIEFHLYGNYEAENTVTGELFFSYINILTNNQKITITTSFFEGAERIGYKYIFSDHNGDFGYIELYKEKDNNTSINELEEYININD